MQNGRLWSWSASLEDKRAGLGNSDRATAALLELDKTVALVLSKAPALLFLLSGNT